MHADIHLPMLAQTTPRTSNMMVEDATDIPYLHSTAYLIIETWMKQPQAKTHPFYITWKQVKYQGLTSTSIWTKILQVLRITNKSEYVKFNQQCSAVKDTITVEDTDGKYIFTWKPTVTMENVTYTQAKVTELHTAFLTMVHKFDSTYHTINNKIEPVNTQFTQINDKISNNFESGTLKVTQQVNKHL